jgi:hypothetical protein
MSGVSIMIFVLYPSLHSARLHLLVPQSRHSGDGNCTSEIIRRELCRL